MLFKANFKKRIREGTVTLTFRRWKAAKVVVGNRYRLGAEDVVVVTAVDEVPAGSITAAQARRAGCAGVDELLTMLRPSGSSRLTSRSKLFRVAFRYERQADARAARREDVSAGSLAEVAARLERMDRRSRRGPWTHDALRLIAAQPQVAAAQLAPRMQRETQAAWPHREPRGGLFVVATRAGVASSAGALMRRRSQPDGPAGTGVDDHGGTARPSAESGHVRDGADGRIMRE